METPSSRENQWCASLTGPVVPGLAGWGAVAMAVVLGSAAGCGAASAPVGGSNERPPAASTGLTAAQSDAVLGFESAAAWTVVGGTAAATNIRTQGQAALEVSAPRPLTITATSAPVSSDATALAGLSSAGATFLVDVFVPAQSGPGSPDQGSLQLFVSSPSRGVNNAYLGMVTFPGLRRGMYRTFKFTIPETVRQQLTAGAFSDLAFRFQMALPGRTTGAYRLDNLRSRTFGAPVPGPGQSVDLVAQLTAAGVNTIGEAAFAAGAVQVPRSFHVKLGSAGAGQTQLVLGFGNTAFVTCTYGGSGDGTSYDLASCDGGFVAGDLVGADHATLHILSASTAGAKIRAQLALNPVGDLVGPGIIPAMPTWWGECVPLATPDCQGPICRVCDASSASQIVTSYFQLVAQNPPMGSTVKTPVGEFARNLGDGSPHDNLTGPPPPNDPLFDREGHLNAGGDWDAYWRLQGNLGSTTDPNTHNNKNTLAAALSAHAVLWGGDVNVAGINLDAFTESGQITSSGFTQQNSGGNLTLSLFGLTLAGEGGTIPTGGSFNYNPTASQDFDLPPIPIWIFSITLGVHAEIGVQLTGNVNPFTIGAAFTPKAAVGAHIEGDINLGVASGGVSADIDLIKVTTPFTANANVFVNTAPPTANTCKIGVHLATAAQLELSTLGGEVDLEASFGVCPFCYSDSWTLFKWDGVNLASQQLFSLEDNPSADLPSTLCIVALDVNIDAPTSSGAVPYGIPFLMTSHAVRPATPGVSEKPIDCGQADAYGGSYLWATSDGNDQFADPSTGQPGPSTGCKPLVTFAKDQSTRTITLNVIDQFGEAGTRQVSIDVVAPPPGPNPFISGASPATTDDGSQYTLGVLECGGAPTVHLVGGEFNGSVPGVTVEWTITRKSDGSSVSLGAGTTSTKTDINGTTVNTTVDWTLTPGGAFNSIFDTYTVTLEATDQDATRQKSITFFVVESPC